MLHLGCGDLLKAKAEVIYTNTIQSSAMTVQTQKREHEANAAKEKEKILDKLMKSSPEDMLNQAIDQRIDSKVSCITGASKSKSHSRSNTGGISSSSTLCCKALSPKPSTLNPKP